MTSNNRYSDNGFAEWLADELQKRRWLPQTLAEEAGVSPTSISNVLNRKRSAGPELLRAIAKALDVSQVEIFIKAGLLDEDIKPDNKAAMQYIFLIRQIKDDDERESVIELVETILKQTTKRTKASKAERSRHAGID